MVLDLKIADIVDAHGVELADVVTAHERKMDAISQEAWYHYAVGSIVTLVAILIAFVVGFKFFR